MKISVIVPVFNEEKTICEIVKKIEAVNIEKEIIIINDGSTDGTAERLNKINSEHIKIFHHKHNLGKGAAIRTALKESSGDIIIIQDADLEYPPEQYPNLIKPITDGFADVVYGSRFLGVHRVFLAWHYFGNKVLTFLANILYDTMLDDIETGCKVFKSNVLRDIKIRSNRFEFEAEITAKIFKKRLKVVEMPIIYYGRDYSEGKKITWKDAIPAIWALIKYRFID
ncbi:MAG: glycosyltransferase family 2 protein [Candidatus Omnitrophota bacterium]|nr:glycosyltransferase family 2 protein [Candidatus Omnitrophota bacterium]